jgi:hypothetical protein
MKSFRPGDLGTVRSLSRMIAAATLAAVAGSFMHLIDRTTEPDATPRPNHLRVVDD